jgi:hypothetical protein
VVIPVLQELKVFRDILVSLASLAHSAACPGFLAYLETLASAEIPVSRGLPASAGILDPLAFQVLLGIADSLAILVLAASAQLLLVLLEKAARAERAALRVNPAQADILAKAGLAASPVFLAQAA